MDRIKEEKVFTTSDGNQYKTKASAIKHEKNLCLEKYNLTFKSFLNILIKESENGNKKASLFADEKILNKMGIGQFESIVNSTMEMLNRRDKGIKKFALKNLKKVYENNEWVYKFKEDEVSVLERYYASDQLNENGIPFEFIEYVEKYNNESIDLSKKVIEKIESIEEKDLVKIGIKIVYATPEEKIEKGIELSEKDIEIMVWERDRLYEEEGESSRWSTNITTVVKGLDGKNYAILWYRGLTEYQENEYYNQPRECKLEEEIITITKTNIIYLDN